MSAHDHERSPLGDRPTTNVFPTSEILQERLHERRARNARPKRVRHTDIGLQSTHTIDDDLFLAEARESDGPTIFDASPMASSARPSDVTRQTSARRRTIGLKDMDEQLDRLHKQNFALKLELDHRREQTQKLQRQMENMMEQMERASALEEEHQELLRINSQLVVELEKRDKAVEEAMDIICDLEDRVGDMEDRGSCTRPSTAHADSGYAGTEMHEQEPRLSLEATRVAKPSYPHVRSASNGASAASEKLQGLLNMQTPTKLKREPSIMSMNMSGTHALRSVYLKNTKSLHPVQSFQSLLSKQEVTTEDDGDGDDLPSSPRMSVLSESSFPSIYEQNPTVGPDQYAWEMVNEEDEPAASMATRKNMHRDSIKRVSQWISERDSAETIPSRSNTNTPQIRNESDRSMPPPAPPSQPEPSVHPHAPSSPARHTGGLDPPVDLSRRDPKPPTRTKARTPHPLQTSFGRPVFGESTLPPTPDSVSTNMLRGSRSSIVQDKMLPDVAPAIVKTQQAVEHGLRTAPRQMRSSVELRTAFASNLRHRNDALDGTPPERSSDEELTHSETEAYSQLNQSRQMDHRHRAPDGGSIKLGTPTRFMTHAKPPTGIPFDLDAVSPTTRSTPRRTRKSIEPKSRNPDQSPIVLDERRKSTTRRADTLDEKLLTQRIIRATSIQSQHSASSGNRTVVQLTDSLKQPCSPEVKGGGFGLFPTVTSPAAATSPSASQKSPSPNRTFSKKMPALFRRISSGHGGDHERSPLPTLTTAPSSTYVNSVPSRPRTSHADRSFRSSGGPGPRHSSSREIERPGPVTKIPTESASAGPASPAEHDESVKERRGLFRRKNSAKTPTSSTAESRSSLPTVNRRGSLRDVATARRPWR